MQINVMQLQYYYYNIELTIIIMNSKCYAWYVVSVLAILLVSDTSDCELLIIFWEIVICNGDVYHSRRLVRVEGDDCFREREGITRTCRYLEHGIKCVQVLHVG